MNWFHLDQIFKGYSQWHTVVEVPSVWEGKWFLYILRIKEYEFLQNDFLVYKENFPGPLSLLFEHKVR